MHFFILLALLYIISFHFNAIENKKVEHAIMLTKKNQRHINTKLQLLNSPENGRRREMGQLGIIKKKKPQRKRLQVRRPSLKNKEEETEMSMSLSPTPPSSSSDHSPENYDVLEGKECGSNVTCLSHGVVSVIGRRKEMEDAVRVELGFMGDEDHHYDFFGVYDGHGGTRVAEECKERLHEVLVEAAAEEYAERNGGVMTEWERVMEGCFGKMDEEVNRGRMKEEMVGSTAVVAVVGKEVVVVANCGDSRAVLSRGGLVVPLSIDHKADRPDEVKRVEAVGGRVINWNGPRIQGVLATSRSIGDQHLKPFVISKPEVTVTKRTDHDEFLILASDGLWDVVSNEVACQVVRRCFSGRIKWASSLDAGNQNRTATAAAVLAELAMSRGSSDNISVIVVELNKPTKFHTAAA